MVFVTLKKDGLFEMTDKTYGPDKLTIEQMHSNKKDAFAAGHSHFFTGQPCIHDHIAPRKIKFSVCLECQKESQKKYNAKFKKNRRILTEEEKFNKRRAYYQANREKLLRHNKEYYKANKEKLKAQKRQYWKDNKERLSQQNRERYQANKERERARDRDRYKKNREENIAKSLKYYRENREKVLDKRKDYRRENKEKISQQKRDYYLRKKKEKEESQKALPQGL